MEDKKKHLAADKLSDELLDQVVGGTGTEEEEDDGTTAPCYQELCEIMPSITCEGCGEKILLANNPRAICLFCGRHH